MQNRLSFRAVRKLGSDSHVLWMGCDVQERLQRGEGDGDSWGEGRRNGLLAGDAAGSDKDHHLIFFLLLSFITYRTANNNPELMENVAGHVHTWVKQG